MRLKIYCARFSFATLFCICRVKFTFRVALNNDMSEYAEHLHTFLFGEPVFRISFVQVQFLKNFTNEPFSTNKKKKEIPLYC